MESATARVASENFKDTLSLLLCECVATAGELSPFKISAKVDETKEGATVLIWTVRKGTASDSIRVILECADGRKPIATLTSVHCNLLETIDLELNPVSAMRIMRPHILKCLSKLKRRPA